MKREHRQLTVQLDMPLELDEQEFFDQLSKAVAHVAHNFGGRTSGSSLTHGTLSRAKHYTAIAEYMLTRT